MGLDRGWFQNLFQNQDRGGEVRVAPAQGEQPEAVTASPQVALRRRDWATLTIIRWEGFETSSNASKWCCDHAESFQWDVFLIHDRGITLNVLGSCDVAGCYQA